MNPLTALLLFYTGAMLRESREVPIIAAQWMVFVVVPAFGATMATGSDAPLFILFAFQLFKVDPEELMNAVINKGSPERIEMEQKIADNFAKILPGSRGESTPTGKTNGAESSSESASGDDTGAPASA